MRHNPLRSSTATEPQLTVVEKPSNVVPLTEPSTLNSQPSTGVKRVNLTGFATKKPSGKTEYPVFPDANGKAAESVDEIRRLTDEAEAIEGALIQHKKFVIELASPFHFEFASGKLLDKGLGILVNGTKDGRVRLDFKDSYPVLESDTMLIPILGQRVGDCFEQSFTFKVEGDKLPKDKAADIVQELQELFARHNATDALTVKEGIKPVAGFHLKRHVLFTAEINLQLNSVCPIRAAVATKNVK